MQNLPPAIHAKSWWGIPLMIPFLLTMAGCVPAPSDPREADIDRRLSRLVRVPMEFDATLLSGNRRELLKALVDAGRMLHEAYLQQVYPPGVLLRDSLGKQEDPLSRKIHRLLVRNGGPFDRMDHFANFVDTFPRPPGGFLYPRDLTKEGLEAYIASHPKTSELLLGPYTVVRRDGEKLIAIPYHVEYARWVDSAAQLLRRAAGLAENASLQRYLTSRAEALQTDDYYQSDLDWIDITDSDVDVTIGPYEVYDDALMGTKAFYEITVGVKEKEESARLEVYTKYLHELEQHLPHDAKYKRSIKGLQSPMVIVTDIFRGGDIATGYQPVAANLPNDPRVHTRKGTKKTFWKNMMHARVQNIILPVGRELIASDQVKYITHQGVFNFVLMHELCHALGSQYVHGTSDKISVSQALKEHYPAVEEAKADVAGLHSMTYFLEEGIIPREMERQHYVSYLASIFRTIRFGTGEAHGKAAICELNFLRDRGGIHFDGATKKWSVNFDRIASAISELAGVLLRLQAEGDRQGVEEFFRRWSGTPRDVTTALQGLEHLPVDVEPLYTIRW